MPRSTLAERQERLAQQRARLTLEENRLREAARKARTRRLIEAGGLVDKAGLLGLDANALFGGLLSLAQASANSDRLARWRVAGGQAFDQDAKARAAGREPLVLITAQALPTTVTTRLRSLGFRWSKVLRHWEGVALHDEAKALADEVGASLTRVAPSVLEDVPSDTGSLDSSEERA